MLRKKIIFCDNLLDYDTLGNWDETLDNGVIYSSNNYLNIYKTPGDGGVESNYIDLTAPLSADVYNFIIEIDFKAIFQSDSDVEYFILLMNDADTVAGVKVNESDERFYFQRDGGTQFGDAQVMYKNIWYRIKFVQSFYQQTSATGKLYAYYKDLSIENNEWVYVSSYSSQSKGINDIRIGHPDADNQNFHYQFKNLILYELEEFP